MTDYILEMKDITKVFGATKALDNVNLKVERNTIHAICGENGAGKSTLMNVLSGWYPSGDYTGTLIFDGKEVNYSGIKDSEKDGIAIIHQELSLIPDLNIMDNIFLGNEINDKGIINWDEQYKKAEKYLTLVGLDDDPRSEISSLSVAKMQLVELAKAISKDVKLLILDEPTASLNVDDSEKLLQLIKSLNEEGITSIIISHKLEEITEIADEITIIRDGHTIETLDNTNKDLDENRIIQGMIGRQMTNRFPEKTNEIGEINYEIKNWTFSNPINSDKLLLDDVNIKIHKGEVVGISGLMGAGRTELALTIYGNPPGDKISGNIYKNGEEISVNNVKEAIKNGIIYLTEDRKTKGLYLDRSIKENITIASLNKISKNSVIDKEKEISDTKIYSDKVKVKSSGIDQNTRYLSGGNQQKVLLARLLYTDSDLLILDEPTKGVDVGAKYEIYELINQATSMGKSVLMISSDMPEVIGLSDRIYVMNEGRIVGELNKGEANQEVIMKTILDGSENTIVSHI